LQIGKGGWKIIRGSGEMRGSRNNCTAIRLRNAIPERKVLCGIQFNIEPLREKLRASPVSLEILMKVSKHMPPI
jgi:hypothetical protein